MAKMPKPCVWHTTFCCKKSIFPDFVRKHTTFAHIFFNMCTQLTHNSTHVIFQVSNTAHMLHTCKKLCAVVCCTRFHSDKYSDIAGFFLVVKYLPFQYAFYKFVKAKIWPQRIHKTYPSFLHSGLVQHEIR